MIEGETRSNPGPPLRARFTYGLAGCYVPERFFAAETSADWKFPTFLFCRNSPSAVSMSVFHALLATMPCALGEREAIGQPVVDAVRARHGCPVVTRARLLLQIDPEVAVGPVAHDVERGLAVGDELRRILPRQRGAVGVRVGEQLLVAVERRLDAGAVPVSALLPERCPAARSERGDHDRLEQVLLRPLLGDRERDQVRVLRLLQVGDEVAP